MSRVVCVPLVFLLAGAAVPALAQSPAGWQLKEKDQLRIFEAQKVAADKEEARLRGLQKTGAASVQQVEKAEADAKALEASSSAAQNQIARAKLDLEYSRITADIGGRISKAELTGSGEVRDRLERELGRPVPAISAVTGQGLSGLVAEVVRLLQQVPAEAVP